MKTFVPSFLLGLRLREFFAPCLAMLCLTLLRAGRMLRHVAGFLLVVVCVVVGVAGGALFVGAGVPAVLGLGTVALAYLAYKYATSVWRF